MRFRLSSELLIALQQRRRQQRSNKVPRRPFEYFRGFFRAEKRSLMKHVQELFRSARPDPQRVADTYVSEMWQLQSEVEDEHDAFLLDPGMGPMLYITSDGRILTDGRSWDDEPLREATDDEAIVAILVGAKKTGISDLIGLLPPKPSGTVTCPTCAGTRFAKIPGLKTNDGREPDFVCFKCKGRGWQSHDAP
jgi:hypothetical protein